MSAKALKILPLAGMAAVIAAIFLFWFYWPAPENLAVDFLDVGQGDAILVKAPAGQNILIDGGPDKSVIRRLAENLPWWDKALDLIILTHPHDDHVAGLIEVLKRYRVKKILFTGVTHSAPAYLNFLEEARDRKITMAIVDRPQTIDLSSKAELKILFPTESLVNKTVTGLNDTSIIAKLIYGQTSVLLTGDAGGKAENNLSENRADLSAAVLKVGHHGSEFSSSQEFLDKVRPKIAVIEVGRDNDFGHPNGRIIKRLERVGAKIYRTDRDGTVKLISDGREFSLEK